MNLTCKLVPVQYQEYEYGLLACITMLQLYTCTTSTKLSEAKPSTTRSYTFSDALRQLHVSQVLIGSPDCPSVCFVIGQSYLFGFGFTKLS